MRSFVSSTVSLAQTYWHKEKQSTLSLSYRTCIWFNYSVQQSFFHLMQMISSKRSVFTHNKEGHFEPQYEVKLLLRLISSATIHWLTHTPTHRLFSHPLAVFLCFHPSDAHLSFFFSLALRVSAHPPPLQFQSPFRTCIFCSCGFSAFYLRMHPNITSTSLLSFPCQSKQYLSKQKGSFTSVKISCKAICFNIPLCLYHFIFSLHNVQALKYGGLKLPKNKNKQINKCLDD